MCRGLPTVSLLLQVYFFSCSFAVLKWHNFASPVQQTLCSSYLLFICSCLRNLSSVFFYSFPCNRSQWFHPRETDILWGALPFILASVFFFQPHLLHTESSTLLTFYDPVADSLQIRMHSYPFVLSLCFSHHFSIFLIFPFTRKTMFYFLPLKKEIQSFPFCPLFYFRPQSHAPVPSSFQFSWASKTFLFTFSFNQIYRHYYYIDLCLLKVQN